ncbi:MAG: sugar O-acetyltransferase [Bacteroidales bacterium]|nr:sugar O-acetyltransferase [Bacteroidales bacterium]
MTAGEEYVGSDGLYADVHLTMQLTAELNNGYKTEDEVREYLRKITGKEIDNTTRIFPPFNINYGKGLAIGKGAFVNFSCTFLSLGGITVEDDVFIGPHCVLSTEYHPEKPEIRHSLLTKPIVIKRNAWIGANVTVLAGVTIGENSIIAAGSVVTKDIPDNVVALGSPAKVLRPIKTE